MVKVDSSSKLISALANGEVLVELEPGNYFVSGLNIRANGTVIQSTDPANRAKIICSANSSSDMLLASGVSGITLKDLILDGNFRNQSGAVRGSSRPRLARFRNCSNVLIQGVHMCNGALDGFRFDTLTNGKLLDNTCELLGHDAFYLMYWCRNVLVKGNKFDINTNSGTRVSMGGTDITIEDNEYFSDNITVSTGPCIEIDKQWKERGIGFKNIIIKNNRMHNTEGSGIWAFMDAPNKVENFQIIGNTIDRTGQYDSGYNGYSNAGIAIGRIPAIVEGNTISNVPNAVIINEFKYPGTEKYTVQFKNNTVKNCAVGFRVDSPRGYIAGDGNTISDVRTLKYGETKNITINAGPVDNVATNEIIKAVVTITDARGWTGTQEIDLETVEVSPLDNGRVTVKYSAGGLYGNRTYNLPASTNASPTGSDWLVGLAITREAGTQEHSFILPGIQGSGLNEFKLRTKDGRYGQADLNIVLVEPDGEEEPTPKQIKIVHKVTMFVDNIAVLEKEYVEESTV